MTDTHKHISAIETEWKGFRFRSRLEARWAVFFEELGFNWRYEAQGYEGEGVKYLPDFTLADGENTFFVEVKGDPDGLIKDRERMIRALDFGGILPNFEDCHVTRKTGLIVLGDIPEPKWGAWFYPMITHYKGLHKEWVSFGPNFIMELGGNHKCWLAALCNLSTSQSIEGDPEKWRVESRFVETARGYNSVIDALRKARGARFEHGERP
jgi:hypothetical protein